MALFKGVKKMFYVFCSNISSNLLSVLTSQLDTTSKLLKIDFFYIQNRANYLTIIISDVFIVVFEFHCDLMWIIDRCDNFYFILFNLYQI